LQYLVQDAARFGADIAAQAIYSIDAGGGIGGKAGIQQV
jgi:hypothetical protein